MWVSQHVKDWFKVSHQAYEDLKVANAALQAELTALKLQAERDRINFDWMRMRVNALEFENKALMQKAYNISLPAPELTTRTAQVPEPYDFSFNDVGDVMAKQLGLNIFDSRTDD